MEFSATLSKGWSITWRNKWLWLLALIPAATGLVSFGFSFLQQNMGLNSQVGSPYSSGGLFLLSCLQLIVSFVVGLINLAARGGLIAAVDNIDRSESYSFGRAFGEGWQKEGPLLFMNILMFGGLIMIIIMVIALAAAGSFFTVAFGGTQDSGGADLVGLLSLLGLCCLAIMIIIPYFVVILTQPFAFRGIMLHEMGVRESIGHGWKVLRGNLGEILLLVLPFALLNSLLGAIFASIIFGSDLLGLIAGESVAGISVISWIVIAVYLALTPIFVLLATWQSAVFTLGYRSWTGKEGLFSENNDLLNPTWKP